MSGYEGAYSSLLQGVSQQLPKMRLVGQVTAQDNMLSDIVTGPRRRPGAGLRGFIELPGEDALSIRTWETDIAGTRVHVTVGAKTGAVRVVSGDMTTMLHVATVPYLVAPKIQDIRVATVGDEFYLLNVTQQPYLLDPVESNANPDRLGFFYVRSGAFSKNYKVTITNAWGTFDLDYTTPSGAGAGDAAASTPEAIAAALVASNTGGLGTHHIAWDVKGAYVYFIGDSTVGEISVVSPSGTTYIQPSNVSKVRTESDLPQLLPPGANGYVMSVGEQNTLRYYKYNDARKEWLESGVWGSTSGIANGPISLTQVGGVWSISTAAMEGRTSGDDTTNPPPVFTTTRKLSGLAAFQNRLVLLSGSMVYLSASNKPRRFFRSTVTSLVDSDTIGVGSSANSSAEYQYAVQFQKDLLLFSQKYQALIPSSGQAITPRTATVLLTSAYSVDVLSEPVPIGRTLLFSAPRSADYFGFMEMVSSQYSDAQYVANDATAHLPKYMGGSCRFGVASSVASMVLFAPTLNTKSLVVYEYSWDGDTKVQQAWHTWYFEYDVASAYFSNEAVNLTFVQNGIAIVCSMDPRQGGVNLDNTKRPFFDINFNLTVVDNKVTLPDWLMTFDPLAATKVRLAVSTGPQAGEPVGIESTAGAEITTVRSFSYGQVAVGFNFRSLLSPTPPIAQDRNGIKIESAKLTVLRFGVNTQNSRKYQISISDDMTEDPMDIDQPTLRFCSSELDPGSAQVSKSSRAIIPARTNADSTSLILYTEGTGEMNVTGIDYTGRFNTRIRRR